MLEFTVVTHETHRQTETRSIQQTSDSHSYKYHLQSQDKHTAHMIHTHTQSARHFLYTQTHTAHTDTHRDTYTIAQIIITYRDKSIRHTYLQTQGQTDLQDRHQADTD